MSENRTITLGGRAFDVPPLVLRHTQAVYPICLDLTKAGIITRALENKGQLMVSAEEMMTLAGLVWRIANAADPSLTREEFDELPITPPELLEGFMVARYQTGAWVEVPVGASAPQGEATGETGRPQSTLSSSSEMQSDTSAKPEAIGSTA